MLLFLALFSCDKEADSFHPIEEAEVVINPVIVSNYPEFQELMAFISAQLDPKTGRVPITEEALLQQFDLRSVTHDYMDMLHQLEAQNLSPDALSQYLIDNTLVIKADPTYAKLPCYEEYKQATANAGITLGICFSTSDSYEAGGMCLVRFGLNIINADTDFNQCLRNTYPNADYP
jgi:hypothetical protein